MVEHSSSFTRVHTVAIHRLGVLVFSNHLTSLPSTLLLAADLLQHFVLSMASVKPCSSLDDTSSRLASLPDLVLGF